MSERLTNAQVEWGGFKLRGTVETIDRGVSKKSFFANPDKTVDHSVAPGMAKVVIEISYTTEVELAPLEALVGEPMLVTASNGRKISFPSMTHEETSPISKEGTATVSACGSPTTDG